MEMFALILRLLHVLFAIFWVGFAITVTMAVSPSLMAMAPPERKAYQLQFLPRQRILISLGAGATLVTGLIMLWTVYGSATGLGFNHARGYWIVMGSLLGLGAFVLAQFRIVPNVKRWTVLLQTQGDPAQIAVLAAKQAKTAPIVLFHMLAATVCMMAAAHGFDFSALNVTLALGTGLGFGLAMLVFSRKIKA